MQSVIVAATSERWAQALRVVRHDLYHLPGYLEFATRHQEPGEAAAFVAEDGDRVLLLPMVVRQVDLPADGAPDPAGRVLDATSPRGYGGPVTNAPDDTGFLIDALAAVRETLRDAGIVALFARLHPLLVPDIGLLGRAGTVVEHGNSISVDLAWDDDAWRRGMRGSHRRDIANAVAAGYRARIDEAWSRLDEFADHYDLAMRRLGAAPFWRLSRDYFLELREALDGAAHLCVAEHEGNLAAAALLTEVDGVVEYHLAATAPRHMAASPSKLIIDFARRWARDRGNRVLHLAGSLRAGDSLEHFKLGFSPVRHPVRSWRVVTDRQAYARLTRAWATAAGTEPDEPSGWFPAYRKPVPSPA